ncbi:hypothetical protein PTSG_12115 [Salpingoeca rosetta]|uniref:TNFR-Cys domain-containing protein n=1 Tax=Salpingoeca rosetta (strain ATCC 50818 / BSB-021) TaxID=946362 RepID=F2U7I1_SALR5|nr:uncharacterized protein PTSG_12115 [Salpingoeca rosetta]EGD83398.1 hypothetical protein PTSG_12115 [Salpingoeca rosetta]|eukprot:XP_004994902.1 hypothetical protein PTSG_12115 [Salpingoeca rosetta]
MASKHRVCGPWLALVVCAQLLAVAQMGCAVQDGGACDAASLVASFGAVPSHVVHNCNNVALGATCIASCDVSGSYTGTPQTLVCGSNSTFQGSLPTCFAPCNPAEDESAIVSHGCRSLVPVGDACTWGCARGYAGADVTRTCTALNANTTAFDAPPPSCTPVPCSLPAEADPQAMDLSDCFGAVHTNSCVIPCAVGYAGATAALTCDNGQFIGTLPMCTRTYTDSAVGLNSPKLVTEGGTLRVEVFDDKRMDLAYMTQNLQPNAWSGRILSDVEIEASITSTLSTIMEDGSARVRTEAKVAQIVAANVLDSQGVVRAAVQDAIDANAPQGSTLTEYLGEEFDRVDGRIDSLQTYVDGQDDGVLSTLRDELESTVSAASDALSAELDGVTSAIDRMAPAIAAAERCLKFCPAVLQSLTPLNPLPFFPFTHSTHSTHSSLHSLINQCQQCPAFTYSATPNMERECQDCTPTHCNAGSYMVPCDRTVGDSSCVTCPSGKYQDASQHRESSCKTCGCPSGSLPMFATCPGTSNFDCLPDGIKVVGYGSCSAGQWQMGGAESGCRSGGSHQSTKLTGGDYGSDYDVTATSTVKFAEGKYRFFCQADDCCKIRLRGPRTFSPIDNGCGGCTSCSGHTHDHDLLAGVYTVEYYMHEFGGGAYYDFHIQRL